MFYLILAVILFLIGLSKGRNINKEKIVSFSLIGGLIAGILSVVSMYIFGLLVAFGGTGVTFEIAEWFFLGGGIGFISLFAGASRTGGRKESGTEKSEETPVNDEA